MENHSQRNIVSRKFMLISPQGDRYTTPEGEFICYTGYIPVGKLFEGRFLQAESCEMPG